MSRSVQSKLNEAYDHIKLYIQDEKELHEMCKACPNYKGKTHDYDTCKHKKCFKFYLAYVHLKWENSYE